MRREHGSRRRVLVVAYAFPPHAAIGTMRTLRVVRQLHARGWDLTVLTGDPASYVPSTPVDMALLERVPGEVRIVRAGAMRAAAVLERFVVRRANRIVFVAAANRDDFAAHYRATVASKFDVVPNGCDSPSRVRTLTGWSTSSTLAV